MRIAEAILLLRKQAARRAAAQKRGLVVPPLLIASLTRRFNLNCAGGYALWNKGG